LRDNTHGPAWIGFALEAKAKALTHKLAEGALALARQFLEACKAAVNWVEYNIAEKLINDCEATLVNVRSLGQRAVAEAQQLLTDMIVLQDKLVAQARLDLERARLSSKELLRLREAERLFHIADEGMQQTLKDLSDAVVAAGTVVVGGAVWIARQGLKLALEARHTLDLAKFSLLNLEHAADAALDLASWVSKNQKKILNLTKVEVTGSLHGVCGVAVAGGKTREKKLTVKLEGSFADQPLPQDLNLMLHVGQAGDFINALFSSLVTKTKDGVFSLPRRLDWMPDTLVSLAPEKLKNLPLLT
jgi:hypothetical protein